MDIHLGTPAGSTARSDTRHQKHESASRPVPALVQPGGSESRLSTLLVAV